MLHIKQWSPTFLAPWSGFMGDGLGRVGDWVSCTPLLWVLVGGQEAELRTALLVAHILTGPGPVRSAALGTREL